MIKVLKWVYNRGRQYERMRLKKMAIEFMRTAELNRRTLDMEMRMPGDYAKKPAPDELKQHEERVRIDQKVCDTLMRMIYPDPNNYTQQNIPAPIDETEL